MIAIPPADNATLASARPAEWDKGKAGKCLIVPPISRESHLRTTSCGHRTFGLASKNLGRLRRDLRFNITFLFLY